MGGVCLIKGAKMESCEENPECLWENSKKTRLSLWSPFLWKHRTALGLCFHALPRSSGRSVQITHYNWLLLSVYMPVWKTKFCKLLLAHHMKLSLVTGHFTPLNLQCINCLRLWIKLVIAWNFSPLPLWAPFSQVPPPARVVNKGSVCTHICGFVHRRVGAWGGRPNLSDAMKVGMQAASKWTTVDAGNCTAHTLHCGSISPVPSSFFLELPV